MVTGHAETETLSWPEARKDNPWVRTYPKEAPSLGRQLKVYY